MGTMKTGGGKTMRDMCRAALICWSGVALAGCASSGGPTAWIGSDQPEEFRQGEFRELSEVPAKPKDETTAADRDRVMNSLIADRERAQYTGETLRGDRLNPLPAPRSEAADDDSSALDGGLIDESASRGQSTNQSSAGENGDKSLNDHENETSISAEFQNQTWSEVGAFDDNSFKDQHEDELNVAVMEADGEADLSPPEFDLAGLRERIFREKLAASAEPNVQLKRSAAFAPSTAPSLPDRVLQLASAVNSLAVVDELISQSEARPAKTWAAVATERATRIVAAGDAADFPDDILLARANEGMMVMAEETMGLSPPVAPKVDVASENNDLTLGQGTENIDIDVTQAPAVTIAAPNVVADELATLKSLVAQQSMSGGRLRLVAHEATFRPGRETAERQLARARLLLLRMMELGAPVHTLELEAVANDGPAGAGDAVDDHIDVFLMPQSRRVDPT